MEKKETLRQYLTYNKDVNEIEQIFINLDIQLKYLHQNGYRVNEINSDTILLEENKYSSQENYSLFMFSSIGRFNNKEQEIRDNLLSLSKLAIGAFISPETGFFDYSKMPTDYIKKYIEKISEFLPNKNYFLGIIENNDYSYYSDYVDRLSTGNGKNNSIQKSKVTQYGKMYTPEDDAAFIQIVFYPVVLISIITVIAVLSKIFS